MVLYWLKFSEFPLNLRDHPLIQIENLFRLHPTPNSRHVHSGLKLSSPQSMFSSNAAPYTLAVNTFQKIVVFVVKVILIAECLSSACIGSHWYRRLQGYALRRLVSGVSSTATASLWIISNTSFIQSLHTTSIQGYDALTRSRCEIKSRWAQLSYSNIILYTVVIGQGRRLVRKFV